MSNFLPAVMHEMCAEYLKGNTAKAAELQIKYTGLMNALFSDVNPIPVKAALNMMGFDVGRGRMPLSPFSEKNTRYLRSVLENHGFLERM